MKNPMNQRQILWKAQPIDLSKEKNENNIEESLHSNVNKENKIK